MSFRVVKKIMEENLSSFKITQYNKTIHFNKNKQRFEFYEDLINGKPLIGFIIRREQSNQKDEAHIILENGLILIFNAYTKRLITMINPRPSQFVRYFERIRLELQETHLKAMKMAHNRNLTLNLNNR